MTPFEEFLFYDSKREKTPGDAITILNFHGIFQFSRFQEAVRKASERSEAAKCAAVLNDDGSLAWGTKKFPIPLIYVKGPVTNENRPDSFVDILKEPGIRFWIYDEPEREKTEIWFQFHHLLTDALGSFLFLNEIFEIYAGRTFSLDAVPSESDIYEHSKPAYNPRLIFSAVKQVVKGSLWAVSPVRIAPLELRAETANSSSNVDSTAARTLKRDVLIQDSEKNLRMQVLFETFSQQETQSLRDFAHKNSVTMNDLLLASCANAIFQFHVKHGQKRSCFSRFFRPQTLLRIGIPVSLRDQFFNNLALRNIVSVIFLDFSAFFRSKTYSLLKKVHREMKKKQKMCLAELLLLELRWLCSLRFNGNHRMGLAWFSQMKITLATILLSNLGVLFRSSTLPRTKDGKLCVGELVLDSVKLASPRMTDSAVAAAVGTYAGKLHFGFNYDPERLNAENVSEICTLWKSELLRLLNLKRVSKTRKNPVRRM